MDYPSIQHIVIQKGKAYIAGSRLRVMDIAAIVEAGGATIKWILENYEVNQAQVYAALAYYYDHKDEIDQQQQADDAYVRHSATNAREHLEKVYARQGLTPPPRD